MTGKSNDEKKVMTNKGSGFGKRERHIMEILRNVLNLIISHWSNIIGGVTSFKLGADTIDSVKKLLPEQLEAKKATQEYLEQSAIILNDQNVKIEDKQWELNTRQELVKSMVQLTAIEAAYNVARATVFAVFLATIYHFLMQFMSRTRINQRE